MVSLHIHKKHKSRQNYSGLLEVIIEVPLGRVDSDYKEAQRGLLRVW